MMCLAAAIAIASVAPGTNYLGRLPGDTVIVTNVREYVSSVADDVYSNAVSFVATNLVPDKVSAAVLTNANGVGLVDLKDIERVDAGVTNRFVPVVQGFTLNGKEVVPGTDNIVRVDFPVLSSAPVWHEPGQWSVSVKPVSTYSEDVERGPYVHTNVAGSVWDEVISSGTVYTTKYVLSPSVTDQFAGRYAVPLGLSYAMTDGPVTVDITDGEFDTPSVSGIYRVSATCTNTDTFVRSAFSEFVVPVDSSTKTDARVRRYLSDTPGTWVKEINDEFLVDVKTIVPSEPVPFWEDVYIRKYTFPDGKHIPCRPTNVQKWWSFTAISPHLVVFNWHCEWTRGDFSRSLTYDDGNGNSATVVVSGPAVPLVEWARENGVPERDISGKYQFLSDLSFMRVTSGAIPQTACAWLMSPETATKGFTGRDTLSGSIGEGDKDNFPYTRTISMCGWGSAQDYDGGYGAYPLVVMIGNRGKNGDYVYDSSMYSYLGSRVYAIVACELDGGLAGSASKMSPYWDSDCLYVNRKDFASVMDPVGSILADWVLESRDREFYVPGVRSDIADFMRTGAPTGDHRWMFPHIYSGDSGTPLFIKFRGRYVLVSTVTSGDRHSAGGPSYIEAFPLLKKLAEQAGDTLNEITPDP